MGRDSGNREKQIVARVGLDEAALDTAFKYCRIKQTLHDGDISRQGHKPGNASDIHKPVQQRYPKRNERQPKHSAALWDPALEQHDDDRRRRAQSFPTDDEPITCVVGIASVCPDVCARREREHELMRVIGKHQQYEYRRGNIQCGRPPGQMIVFGFSKGKSYKQRHERNKEHWNIVSVPKLAVHVKIHTKVEFNSAYRQPKYNENGGGKQIPPYLLLHDAAPYGYAPCAKQTDVNKRAHKPRKRWQRSRVPDETQADGKKDQQQDDNGCANKCLILLLHCAASLPQS